MQTSELRKAFFTQVVNSDILELLKKNKEKQVMQKLLQIIEND